MSQIRYDKLNIYTLMPSESLIPSESLMLSESPGSEKYCGFSLKGFYQQFDQFYIINTQQKFLKGLKFCKSTQNYFRRFNFQEFHHLAILYCIIDIFENLQKLQKQQRYQPQNFPAIQYTTQPKTAVVNNGMENI